VCRILQQSETTLLLRHTQQRKTAENVVASNPGGQKMGAETGVGARATEAPIGVKSTWKTVRVSRAGPPPPPERDPPPPPNIHMLTSIVVMKSIKLLFYQFIQARYHISSITEDFFLFSPSGNRRCMQRGALAGCLRGLRHEWGKPFGRLSSCRYAQQQRSAP
jgi:hypothetical protein